MIAESRSATVTLEESLAVASGNAEQPSLSLSRIAASLQVILAARRAARTEDYSYWYTIARGL